MHTEDHININKAKKPAYNNSLNYGHILPCHHEYYILGQH